MAAREGQGLQIAVIMFAMLTIILAITTYIFYAQAESSRKEKQDAEVAKSDVEALNRKYLYRIAQLKVVLGLGGIAQADVDAMKATVGGDDAEVTEVKAAFDADMALFGNVAPAGAMNYRTLPGFLLKEVNRKHEDTQVALTDRATAEAAKVTAAAADAGRVTVAEGKIAAINTEKDTILTSFTEDRATLTKEKDDLAARLTKKDAEMKKQADEFSKQIQQMTATAGNATRLSEAFKIKVDELERGTSNLFENPDGRITWVNQKSQLVWVNLGRADGLERQTTFSVYDHNENGVANAKPKGRIEVVAVKDDHLSECRILEDKVANPILPNDIIHSPAWSPGQRIHFALAGFMDVDGDHVSDRALIRNVITLNGGVIDAELTDEGKMIPGSKIGVSTRYLVIGDKPTGKIGETAILTEYSNMIGQAQQYGAEQISVQDLLNRMGWKAEERTVELGKKSSAADFRRRTAGNKAAPGGASVTVPAGAAPAAEPAVSEPAVVAPDAAEAVDPFK